MGPQPHSGSEVDLCTAALAEGLPSDSDQSRVRASNGGNAYEEGSDHRPPPMTRTISGDVVNSRPPPSGRRKTRSRGRLIWGIAEGST